MSFDLKGWLKENDPEEFQLDGWLKENDPDQFDLNQWLEKNDPDKQSGLKDAANTLLRGAHEGWTGALEGADRMVSSLPELIGAAAGKYTELRQQGVDAGLSEEEKRQQLETIARNTQQIRPELEQSGALGRGLVGMMDAAGRDADQLQARRQRVKEALPVDSDFEQSIPGGVITGLGQIASQVPLYLTGLGLPAAATQMYDQGYQDAKANGADEGTAAMAGIGNMPGAALEFAADKLQLGPVMDLVKKGKAPPTALLTKLAEKMGMNSRAGKAAVGVAGSAAAEGATEALQQVQGNVVAQALYDEDRTLTEGAGQAALIGGITGGLVRGGAEGVSALLAPKSPAPAAPLDTGMNVPETLETLRAQQTQLLEGSRPAMMFPAGSKEALELPEGFARVETPRGIFHFDPDQITADEIQKISGAGRENEILGLGPVSKPEAIARAAAGDPPVSVTERQANGTEVKGAMATKSTAAAVKAALEDSATEGNTVQVETPQQTVLARLQAQNNAKAAEAKARMEKEEQARAARQAELKGKQEQFESTLAAARALAARPDADYAALSAASNSLTSYVEDSALGLRQEQRNQALAELKKLAPRTAAAKQAFETEAETRASQAKAAADAAAAARQAAIAADKAQVAAAEKAGIKADGSIDYGRLDDQDLETRVNAGDERAGREIMRRAELDQDPRESLLDALREVKLPTDDRGLGAELALLKEDMTPRQKMQLLREGGKSLDAVAEALRGRGFTQIVTPDDVVTFTQRALRGENVRAAESSEQQMGDVAYARTQPNRLDIGEMRNLDQRERVIEERLADKLNGRLDAENDAEYDAIPDTKNGRVLNVDLARELSEEYQADRTGGSVATHRPASSYISDRYQRQLARKDLPGAPAVLFLAGGSGSGKTSAHRALFSNEAEQIQVDSQLTDFDEARAMMDAAIKSGRMVRLVYVHRPVELAVEGAVARSREEGRIVPVSVIAKGHFRAQQVVRKLAKHYAGNRAVDIAVVDNSRGRAEMGIRPEGVDFLEGNGVAYRSEDDVQSRAAAAFERIAATLPVTNAARFRGERTLGTAVRGRTETGDRGERSQVRQGQGRGSPVLGFQGLSARQVDKQWARIKQALGSIADEFDLRLGAVADVLQDEGYFREAALLRAGKLGSIEAATARRHPLLRRVRAQQQFIVVASEQARQGKAGGLVLHELAHPFYDSLPGETRELLREMQQRETSEKSGPLYRDGKKQTDIAITAEELMESRVKADPELPVKEWFAERVRILNTAWLEGRSIADDPMMKRLWRRFVDEVRRIWAHVRGVSRGDELFETTFRDWLAAGTKLDISQRAQAYAQRQRPQFAAQSAKANPEEVIRSAARVTPIPPVDRKQALLKRWREAKELRDEGNRTGNDTALMEGQKQVNALKQRLDEEFPDWETEGYAKKSTPAPRAFPEDDGRNLPPPPPDEPSESAPPPEDPPPPNRGRAKDIYGHTAHVPTFGERAIDYIRSAIVGIRGPIPELPAFPALARNSDRFIRTKGEQFYNRLKEFYRVLNSGNDFVQRTAEEQLDAITGPLLRTGTFKAKDYKAYQARREQVRTLRADGKSIPPGVTAELRALEAALEDHPYVLFNRTILFLDLDWRAKNLKDSAGNPITLPEGMNQTEVTDELARLAQLIETSPQKKQIETALERHVALVSSLAEDLKNRELLAAEHLDNPYYFPHLTLEITRGDKTVQRELRPERVRIGTEADFRGYLIDPVGSRKPIETDYVRAMYYHLVQVGGHNLKADAVKNYAKSYDIRAQVDETAKRLSKQRGQSVSWEQAFHEVYEKDGYVMYGTDSRDAFPTVMIDRDKLARRLGTVLTSEDLQGQLRELGLRGITLLPEDLKETLIQGQRETWIVPARVAEALRGIADRQTRSDRPLEAALKRFNGWWKAWKLFMPQNHLRYEYGNVVADLEKVFSASPRTFLHVGRAAKELRAMFQGEPIAADLRAALKEGVINAITAAEMNQLQRLRAFEKFETAGEKIKNTMLRRGSSMLFQPISNAVGLGDLSSVEISAFREGVTRYANFLANLDALRNKSRPDYAGAYWKDIDAIQESQPGAGDRRTRQAAQIAKATFGDYSDLSDTGQYLRDKLIPFYSWMEVNFKYHSNLFRNLRDMVKGEQISGGRAAAAGARAIAAATIGTGSRLAGGMLLRLAVPYIAVALWNNSGGREELEDELSEEDRRRFHIILGRTEDGKINVVYANTAFADVMKWFSGAKFAQQMAAWLDGRTDLPTAMASWASEIPSDLANNTLGSAGPTAKILVAATLKKATFPDVTDAKTIPAYDLRRHILGQLTDDFTADLVERAVSKDYMAPKDFGTWAKQLILQVRQRDPEQWAFYSIKDKAADFYQERTGKSRDMSYDAPDQQVLRNFRKAIYQGDLEQASTFYLRLLDLGYTSERFAASIRAQDPLSALPKQDGTRKAFVESLDPIDQEMLRRAYAFYARMSGNRGQERQLFPSDREGPAGLERMRNAPRLDQLRQAIESATELDGDGLERRINRDLQTSLRGAR